MAPRILMSDALRDGRLVEYVTVVCLTTDNEWTNHWVIFLELKDTTQPWISDVLSSEGSSNDDDGDVETIQVVRLNMRMMGSAIQGELQTSELQYYESESECTSWAFVLHKPTSIGDIVQLIVAKRRHVFTWSQNGSGCRHWVHTIVEDLAKERILRADAAKRCRYLMNYSYNPNGDLRELEWDEGVFGEEEEEDTSAGAGPSSLTL